MRDLSALIPPFSFPEVSPDWHYIVWTNFRNPGVHIVDLRTHTVRTVQLPRNAKMRTLIVGTSWSSNGDVLATQRPFSKGNWTYWMINPASDTVTQINGQNQMGVLLYTESGVTIGVSCPLCEGVRPVNKIETSSGAVVYISISHDLIVQDPDGSLTIVAKHVPPPPTPPGIGCGCGPQGKYPAFWTIFDGDVVLYSFGRELWVYGIAEHEKSPLGVAPIELAF